MKEINSLVVEDNVITQKFIHKIMKDFGTCDVGNDGQEGLEQFEKNISENNYYDVICLDIQMPKLDGVQLLEKIRKMEKENQQIKRSVIIMITAIGDKEINKKCVKLGCNSFLLKPVDKENLSKVLRRHHVL